jgi:hypothetical protein
MTISTKHKINNKYDLRRILDTNHPDHAKTLIINVMHNKNILSSTLCAPSHMISPALQWQSDTAMLAGGECECG